MKNAELIAGILIAVLALGGAAAFGLTRHTTAPIVPATATTTYSVPTVTSSSSVIIQKKETALNGLITGTVSLGPTCPVQKDPPDAACADKPYATELELVNTSGTVVRTFSSSESGTFTLHVIPGTYSIRQGTTAKILPRCASTNSFVVSGNDTTHVAVSCDSGIR